MRSRVRKRNSKNLLSKRRTKSRSSSMKQTKRRRRRTRSKRGGMTNEINCPTNYSGDKLYEHWKTQFRNVGYNPTFIDALLLQLLSQKYIFPCDSQYKDNAFLYGTQFYCYNKRNNIRKMFEDLMLGDIFSDTDRLYFIVKTNKDIDTYLAKKEKEAHEAQEAHEAHKKGEHKEAQAQEEGEQSSQETEIPKDINPIKLNGEPSEMQITNTSESGKGFLFKYKFKFNNNDYYVAQKGCTQQL